MSSTHKRGISTSAEEGPPAKHHKAAALKDSPEEILGYIAPSVLKSCFESLLDDAVASPIAERQLRAYALLAETGEHTRLSNEARKIRKEATAATTELLEEAQENKRGRVSSWGRAISPFLPRVHEIWKAGAQVDGPNMAFDTLCSLAHDLIIPPLDGCRLQGAESENNPVHHEIQRMMLAITREVKGPYGSRSRESWEQTPEARSWALSIKLLNQALKGHSYRYNSMVSYGL